MSTVLFDPFLPRHHRGAMIVHYVPVMRLRIFVIFYVLQFIIVTIFFVYFFFFIYETCPSGKTYPAVEWKKAILNGKNTFADVAPQDGYIGGIIVPPEEKYNDNNLALRHPQDYIIAFHIFIFFISIFR